MSGVLKEKPKVISKTDHKLAKILRKMNTLSNDWWLLPDADFRNIHIQRVITKEPYIVGRGYQGKPSRQTVSVTREEFIRFMNHDPSVLPMLIGTTDEFAETVDSILARARLQLGI